MPGLDRSGPEGRGTRTGRGLGQCNPEAGVEQATGFGRGMGQRRGFQGAGRCGFLGRRGGSFQSNADNRTDLVPPASEQESLKTEVADLQRSLAEIQARLEGIEKNG